MSDGVIKIEKLGASKSDESITNIDVVLTARRPEGDTVIVGWYKNATVFRKKQQLHDSIGLSDKDIQGNQYGYRFYAPENQVTRLRASYKNTSCNWKSLNKGWYGTIECLVRTIVGRWRSISVQS